jgi:hypothetical protein
MKNLFLLFLSLLVVTSCNRNNKKVNDFDSGLSQGTMLQEDSSASASTTDTITDDEKRNIEISKCLLVQPQQFVVDPSSDTSITIGNRGTKINIPANAFVDKKGCVVTSKVEINIKEYTTPAEMAFSQIPMTYTDKKGNEYNFNSAGMFDISGFSKGEAVQIAPNKTLNVDYALVQKTNGIDFYKLEDATGKWEQIQMIKTISQRKKLQEDEQPEIHFTLTNPRNMNCNLWFNKEGDEEENEISIESFVQEKYKVPSSLKKYLDADKHQYQSFSVQFTLDSASGELQNIKADVRNPTKRYDKDLVALIKSLPPCNYTLLNKKSLSPFKDVYQLSLHRNKWVEREVVVDNDETLILNRTIARVKGKLTDNAVDNDYMKYAIAGHTYPDIVKGLQVSSFGVYNCDQIYRLQNKVNIMANYINEQEDTIQDVTILSLIDLEYNAAFSFYPSLFTCNSKANNVLLLFTKTGKLYILDKGKFQKTKINDNGQCTFKMRNVTDELTSTDKLQAYLGLNTTKDKMTP